MYTSLYLCFKLLWCLGVIVVMGTLQQEARPRDLPPKALLLHNVFSSYAHTVFGIPLLRTWLLLMICL